MFNQTNHTSPGNAANLQRICRKSSPILFQPKPPLAGPIGLVTHSSAKEPSSEVMRQFGSSEKTCHQGRGDTSPMESFPGIKNTERDVF